MPSHHAPAGTLARAHFYGQLATLLGAGLPVVQTLDQLARNPPHPSLREPVGTLLGCLKSGRTFTESFQLLGRWAPAFDIALIHAGELSGRLDQTFKTLARHHQERAANNRLLLRESFYPAIVLHASIFIIPIPALIRSGSIVQYLLQTFGVLILIYAVVGLVLWALRGDRPQPWRAFIEGMVLKIPLLGSARADLALSRLAASLEALTTAGILITEAWPLAAAASGSPLIQRTVARWRELLDAGESPSNSLQTSGAFPELFASTYQTGEISGRLEEQLLWLARHYESEGFSKLRTLGLLAPRLLYGFIIFWVVLHILSLASGYQSLLEQLLQD